MVNNFNELASYIRKILETDNRTYLLISDGLEYYFLGDFKNTWSEDVKKRIINTGISEQNAVSVAAGLAMSGKIPYVLMFSPFMIMRAAEQIKLNICYANANVKLIGTNAGMSYTFCGGYSHCLLEDVAFLNALPNIRIYSPSPNRNEFKTILKEAHSFSGPVYIRLNASFVSNWDDNCNAEYKENKIVKLIKGNKAAIIGTGFTVKLALDIAKELKKRLKYSPSVYSAYCLRPFDTETIQKLINKRIPIISIEDHSRGGLASIIATEIAKSGKSLKFLPIYVENNNFNVVKMTIEEQLNAFLDYEKMISKYFKFIEDKKFLFLSKNVVLTDKREKCCQFKIFGITFISFVRRLKRKKRKLRNKYYLFGSIRVL